MDEFIGEYLDKKMKKHLNDPSLGTMRYYLLLSHYYEMGERAYHRIVKKKLKS